jgi:hypothetical protein
MSIHRDFGGANENSVHWAQFVVPDRVVLLDFRNGLVGKDDLVS